MGEHVGEWRARKGLVPVALLLLLAAVSWRAPAVRRVAAADQAGPPPEVMAESSGPKPEVMVESSGPKPEVMRDSSGEKVMRESSAPTPQMTVLLGDPQGPPVPPPQPAPVGRVPVLVYHHFLPEAVARSYPGAELIVTTENFSEQMRLLSEGGYHTITTADLAAWLLHGQPLPEKPVLVTFDDGYESQYVYALPILKKYNIKATVFIITGDVAEQNPPYNPRVLSSMDWKELKAMAATGLVDVEDHTHAMHQAIQGKGAALSLSDQAVLADLALSRKLLADRLGIEPPLAFAYPRGDYDARYIDLVKRSGFQLAFTVASGPVRAGDSPYTLHRIGVFRNHWLGTFRKMVDGQYP